MADKSEEEKAKAAEANIEIWKIKKLIKKLEEARGCAGCHNYAAAHPVLTHAGDRAWANRVLAHRVAATERA